MVILFVVRLLLLPRVFLFCREVILFAVTVVGHRIYQILETFTEGCLQDKLDIKRILSYSYIALEIESLKLQRVNQPIKSKGIF